jgi:ribosome-associated heat shock protein Hsp15
MESQRLDKWLWAARFYKTRGLAVEEINKGRVQLNEQDVKPARDVRPGDRISVRQGSLMRVVVIRGLSGQRGPAPAAEQLYEETQDSRLAREASTEQRRLAAEPALSIAQGRPTKRDRRKLDDAGWDERWSASIDR